MATQVTDPALLAQLNGDADTRARPVTDPAVLAALNSDAPTDASNAPSEFSLASLGRQAALMGRAVLNGINGVGLFAADAGVGARNLVNNLRDGIAPTVGDFNPLAGFGIGPTDGSRQEYSLPSHMFNQGLTELGVPVPETKSEKAAGLVEAVLSGAKMPMADVPKVAPAVVKQGLTTAQDSAAASGKAIGMKMTPGQASGSKSLQQLEAKLESQPWTSGPANAIKAQNQVAANRAWAKAIGEDSDVVDSTVLARADDRLGDVFQSVRGDRVHKIDTDEVTGTIGKINGDFDGLLPSGANVVDQPLVQQLLKLAKEGQATGEQLGSLTSKLGKSAFKQMTSPNGDRDLGQALYAVKDQVDDLVSKGLPSTEKAAYDAARKQYRSLLQLTARVGNVNPSTGNVNPISIASYLQKADKKGFLYGGNQSDAYTAARFGQAFKPIVGDSGTATRSLNLSDLATAPIGIPANVFSRLYYGGGGGLLTKGAPNVSPGLFNTLPSWENYLENGNSPRLPRTLPIQLLEQEQAQ